jgi:hypothetical protein
MMRLILVSCLAFVLLPICPAELAAGEPGLAARCARAGNDDTVRPYDPSLQAELLKAYARQFPQARMPPDNRVFQAGSHIRCMDGRLRACFTGANLPCTKMNTSRDNKGADAFCQSDPQAEIVPAFAVGHDAAYSYRCAAGRAEITGETFSLDHRGFAASLWTTID